MLVFGVYPFFRLMSGRWPPLGSTDQSPPSEQKPTRARTKERSGRSRSSKVQDYGLRFLAFERAITLQQNEQSHHMPNASRNRGGAFIWLAPWPRCPDENSIHVHPFLGLSGAGFLRRVDTRKHPLARCFSGRGESLGTVTP